METSNHMPLLAGKLPLHGEIIDVMNERIVDVGEASFIGGLVLQVRYVRMRG